MIILPHPTDGQVRRIYGMIKSYLWGKGKIKIPFNVLEMQKNHGGLKLTNVTKRFQAL